MNNKQFLQTIKQSFLEFLRTGSRSNKKLIILHGAIAKDIKSNLGGNYEIKSLGVENGKEGKLNGRYMEKTVDILVSKGGNDLAGIGVKFVMNNYSQNSNNYFENMLGETANIRTNRKDYFQILILPDECPYYNSKGMITKWEQLSTHNIDKYAVLSKDNIGTFLHTPVKTLLFVIKFPDCDRNTITTRAKYKKYYLNHVSDLSIQISANIDSVFDSAVVLNDYPVFIDKIIHCIKSM